MESEPFRRVFTVFTPTYNRAATLHRVYESLCKQTFRDFEWLIVDDGSTDETESMVQSWQEQAPFTIRGVRQAHAGISTAFNVAVRMARGEFILRLDSDDACVPESLERFLYHWNSIPAEQRELFSAVTALSTDQHGRIDGDKFPYDVTDSNSLEIRYRHKVSRGDKWGFQRTDVLRQHVFPVLPAGQGHVREGFVWNAIARRYQTRYVNEALHITWRNETGRADHQSQRSIELDAPGAVLYFQDVLNHDVRWVRCSPRSVLIEAMQFSRFCFHARKGLVEQFTLLDNSLARLLWTAALPIGLAAFLNDRLRR